MVHTGRAKPRARSPGKPKWQATHTEPLKGAGVVVRNLQAANASFSCPAEEAEFSAGLGRPSGKPCYRTPRQYPR